MYIYICISEWSWLLDSTGTADDLWLQYLGPTVKEIPILAFEAVSGNAFGACSSWKRIQTVYKDMTNVGRNAAWYPTIIFHTCTCWLFLVHWVMQLSQWQSCFKVAATKRTASDLLEPLLGFDLLGTFRWYSGRALPGGDWAPAAWTPGWEIGSVVIQNGIPMHIQIYIWYIPSRNGGDDFVVFPLFAIIYRSFHNFELEPSAQR